MMCTSLPLFMPFSSQVLFVVQKNEKNIYDHHIMEQDLFTRYINAIHLLSIYRGCICRHGIKVLKRNLSEIEEEGRLEPDRTLIM